MICESLTGISWIFLFLKRRHKNVRTHRRMDGRTDWLTVIMIFRKVPMYDVTTDFANHTTKIGLRWVWEKDAFHNKKKKPKNDRLSNTYTATNFLRSSSYCFVHLSINATHYEACKETYPIGLRNQLKTDIGGQPFLTSWYVALPCPIPMSCDNLWWMYWLAMVVYGSVVKAQRSRRGAYTAPAHCPTHRLADPTHFLSLFPQQQLLDSLSRSS